MTARLDTERRLLAALILWPRAVNLEPRHFAAPEHAALYRAIAEIGDGLRDDTKALPLLRGALERDAEANMPGCFKGLPESAVRSVGQWYEDYIIGLMACEVTEHAITDLVESVRECPRCGK